MNQLEMNIVGSLMRENKLFATAEHYHLTPESFADSTAREIFTKMLTFIRRGEAVDFAILTNALPKLEMEMGEIFVNELAEIHFPDWCEELKKNEARRELGAVCSLLQRRANDPDGDVPGICAEAVSKIEAARSTAAGFREKTLEEIGEEIIREATTDQPKKIIPLFPANTEGFQRVRIHQGEFFVLGANTGGGKTALCAAAAVEQLRQGFNILYACSESSTKDIYKRMGAVMCGIPHYKDKLTGEEAERLTTAINELRHDRAAQLHIMGNDNGPITPSRIRQKLREIEKDGAAEVVYVDFLQDLAPDTRLRSKLEEVDTSIQAIHGILAEYQAAGIVISQFNRASEKDGGLAELTWLKDTSYLGQLAHTVAFLQKVNGVPNLFSRKTRNCAPFSIELRWNGVTYESADAYSGKYACEN